jgi:hypothetical protein
MRWLEGMVETSGSAPRFTCRERARGHLWAGKRARKEEADAQITRIGTAARLEVRSRAGARGLRVDEKKCPQPTPGGTLVPPPQSPCPHPPPSLPASSFASTSTERGPSSRAPLIFLPCPTRQSLLFALSRGAAAQINALMHPQARHADAHRDAQPGHPVRTDDEGRLDHDRRVPPALNSRASAGPAGLSATALPFRSSIPAKRAPLFSPRRCV